MPIEIQKVTDPLKITTDPVLLSCLTKQGIDKDYVELFQDYASSSLGKEHSPYAKFYRDLKSNKLFMVVSGLPKVDENGVKVEVGWTRAGNIYNSKANLFQARVQGTTVEIVDKLSYNPQLFLRGVEQSCGRSSLLPVDPINSNYLENTLEWDYGICKRRLRLIEGAILGSWVFGNKPAGEIRIKYNQAGNIKLGLGQFAITDDEEVIKPEDFDKLTQLPPGGYPVIISDDLTVYATASDGSTYLTGTVWLTVRNATTGHDTVYATGTNLSIITYFATPSYALYRGFEYFNTSALPDDCTITGAVLSLYGYAQGEIDAGHADLCLYAGTQADPLVKEDYDSFGATLLTAGSYSYEYPWSLIAYTAATLNAAGLAVISKTGTTKFALRVKGDVDAAAPTGNYNYMYPFSNEKGAGYLPKLVVTYTPAAGGGGGSSQIALLYNRMRRR